MGTPYRLRRERQIAKIEQLAGVYRPITDPQAQAAAIAEVIRPLLAEKLAAIRAPLPPAPKPRPDVALAAACRELDAARRAYDRAKAGNGRLTIYRTLQRVEKAVVAVCEASREAGRGSR